MTNYFAFNLTFIAIASLLLGLLLTMRPKAMEAVLVKIKSRK